MKKLLIALVAAFFLAGAGGAHALTCTTGDYCGTYTVTDAIVTGYGDSADLPGLSTPGSVTQVNGVNFTTLSSPFNVSLPLLSQQAATAFFTTTPAGGCDSACNNMTGQPANTLTEATLTATFYLTDPNGKTQTVVATATYTADYDGNSDTVDWSLATGTGTSSQGGQTCYAYNDGSSPTADTCETLFANFSDGASVAITLSDAADWNITPFVSFELVTGPKVPEPASLALFGTALAGFGLMRRRRKGV